MTQLCVVHSPPQFHYKFSFYLKVSKNNNNYVRSLNNSTLLLLYIQCSFCWCHLTNQQLYAMLLWKYIKVEWVWKQRKNCLFEFISSSCSSCFQACLLIFLMFLFILCKHWAQSTHLNTIFNNNNPCWVWGQKCFFLLFSHIFLYLVLTFDCTFWKKKKKIIVWKR